MTTSEHKTPRVAVKLTGRDKAALELVKRCGFVAAGGDGQPGLESSAQISAYRFERLLALGELAANDDGLFDWCPQTYRLTETHEIRHGL